MSLRVVKKVQLVGAVLLLRPKDQVAGTFSPELPRLYAQYKADGIHEVRLARAVGSDDAGELPHKGIQELNI